MVHDAGDVGEDGDSRARRRDQPVDFCLLGDICHIEVAERPAFSTIERVSSRASAFTSHPKNWARS